MGARMVEEQDNVIPFPSRPRAVATGPTFRELADEWMATEGLRLVEPANERRHIDHLRSLWGLTEATLRPRQVKAALAQLLRPTGPLGEATVNKVRATGRRIVREAQINDRWSGPNPFDIVRRLRERRPTHRRLDLQEVRALLPHLREDRRREALTMLYLGLRPGELKALRREDLELSAGMITVRRSNARNQTKTGKERALPLPLALRPVLEAALDAAPPGCDLVFPDANGQLERADVKLSKTLRAALRAAGLVTGYAYACRRKGCGHKEERRSLEQVRCPACGMKLWASGQPIPVRWYDLRHSAATLHREAGCDPLVIQVALGHAAQNLTDGIYTSLSIDYIRRELDKLSI